LYWFTAPFAYGGLNYRLGIRAVVLCRPNILYNAAPGLPSEEKSKTTGPSLSRSEKSRSFKQLDQPSQHNLLESSPSVLPPTNVASSESEFSKFSLGKSEIEMSLHPNENEQFTRSNNENEHNYSQKELSLTPLDSTEFSSSMRLPQTGKDSTVSPLQRGMSDEVSQPSPESRHIFNPFNIKALSLDEA